MFNPYEEVQERMYVFTIVTQIFGIVVSLMLMLADWKAIVVWTLSATVWTSKESDCFSSSIICIGIGLSLLSHRYLGSRESEEEDGGSKSRMSNK